MYVHNLNPTILHLGPVEIRWYGLVYVFGFLAAAWWLNHCRKKGRTDLQQQEIGDLIFYVLVGLLAGARLFMIFWQPEEFLFKPWNLLKIWEGGMSFHGGLAGSILGAWLYARKLRLDFWKIADLISVPAIFALALGRIANFINGELVGRTFNGKWCVIFPEYDSQCRHPNMIYSFFQRMLVFGWLSFLHYKHQFKPGFIFWNMVFWEGLGRLVVDFFRENNLVLGLSLGQWLSLVMILISLYFFNQRYRDDWRRLF